MRRISIEFQDMTDGRLVTLAAGSTSVWKIAGKGTSESGDFAVLDAFRMDGYKFCWGDANHVPRMYASLEDVTLYPYEETTK